MMFFAVIEVAVSYVYLFQAVVDDTVYGRVILGAEAPISGKVVSDPVRYKTESDVFFVFGIG